MRNEVQALKQSLEDREKQTQDETQKLNSIIEEMRIQLEEQNNQLQLLAEKEETRRKFSARKRERRDLSPVGTKHCELLESTEKSWQDAMKLAQSITTSLSECKNLTATINDVL